jgi:hypothetical protein
MPTKYIQTAQTPITESKKKWKELMLPHTPITERKNMLRNNVTMSLIAQTNPRKNLRNLLPINM